MPGNEYERGIAQLRVLRDAIAEASSLDWTEEFVLTEEEAQAIQDPDWIYPDLVVSGHVVAVIAEPGAGKTTILAGHVCPEMVKAGYKVFYVNADTSGADAKVMLEQARDAGFTMMTPDLKGRSMQDIVGQLETMTTAQDADWSEVVFVFDTLKKMTEVIEKRAAKKLYSMLRALSGRGMIVVLAGHTNKYPDKDGNPVFEGTGDLRSDVDDLIYLIPQKYTDGSSTVSTDPDAPTAKKRGTHQPITFHIHPDRTVTKAEAFVDVKTREQHRREYEADHGVIEAITEAIRGGNHKTTDIYKAVKDSARIGRTSAERVLKKFSDPKHTNQQWRRDKTFQRNETRYYPLDAPGF